MGYGVDCTTAKLFMEKFEEEVLNEYKKEGIKAIELSVIDEVVILHTEEGYQIPIAKGDNTYVDWLDRYNIGEEIYDKWDNLYRIDHDEWIKD